MENLTTILDKVKSELNYNGIIRLCTKAGIGSDIAYRKKMTTIKQAETYKYHSDYWGYSETYKEQNVTAMRLLRPYFNKPLEYKGKTCKIIAMLVDIQYNSISNTGLLIEYMD